MNSLKWHPLYSYVVWLIVQNIHSFNKTRHRSWVCFFWYSALSVFHRVPLGFKLGRFIKFMQLRIGWSAKDILFRTSIFFFKCDIHILFTFWSLASIFGSNLNFGVNPLWNCCSFLAMWRERCLKAKCDVVFQPKCPDDSNLISAEVPEPPDCCQKPGSCQCNPQVRRSGRAMFVLLSLIS